MRNHRKNGTRSTRKHVYASWLIATFFSGCSSIHQVNRHEDSLTATNINNVNFANVIESQVQRTSGFESRLEVTDAIEDFESLMSFASLFMPRGRRSDSLPLEAQAHYSLLIVRKLYRSGVEAYDTERGIAIHIPCSLYQQNDIAKLRTESLSVIQDIANILNDFPDREILVEGHTDLSGRSLSNRALSLKRAQELAYHLEKFGVDRERLKMEGLGEAHPLTSGGSQEQSARNCRVEIIMKR